MLGPFLLLEPNLDILPFPPPRLVAEPRELRVVLLEYILVVSTTVHP
jgi:hypothetical protein